MIKKVTGLPWIEKKNNGLCISAIPQIKNGLKKLEESPDEYEKYVGKSGFCTAKDVVMFLRMIVDQWETIEAEHPVIAKTAMLWVGPEETEDE